MTYSKKFENRINKLGLYGKKVRVSYSGRKYVVDDPETFEIFEIFKNFDEIDNYLVTKEFEQIEKEAEEMLIEEVEKELNQEEGKKKMKIWKKENFLKAVENEVKTWKGTGLKSGVTYLWIYNSLKFKATDKNLLNYPA